MKKQLAALAAAFLLMTGTASAADGSVEGKIRGPMDLGLDVVVRDSGTGNWDRAPPVQTARPDVEDRLKAPVIRFLQTAHRFPPIMQADHSGSESG